MVTPNRNYELRYHNCSLTFILYVSEIENLLNAKNDLYSRCLFLLVLYSAFTTNPSLPTTPLLGSKQNKLKETCRKLHIEELLDCIPHHIIFGRSRIIRVAQCMARMGQNKNTYRVLVS